MEKTKCKRRRLAVTSGTRLLNILQEEYSCSNPLVYIGKSSLGGNGLFLAENIEQNTKILTVPLELIITEQKALESKVGRAVQAKFGHNVPHRIILILYFLYMKHSATADTKHGDSG